MNKKLVLCIPGASPVDQGDTGHTSSKAVLKGVRCNRQNHTLPYHHRRIDFNADRYQFQPLEARRIVY